MKKFSNKRWPAKQRLHAQKVKNTKLTFGKLNMFPSDGEAITYLFIETLIFSLVISVCVTLIFLEFYAGATFLKSTLSFILLWVGLWSVVARYYLKVVRTYGVRATADKHASVSGGTGAFQFLIYITILIAFWICRRVMLLAR